MRSSPAAPWLFATLLLGCGDGALSVDGGSDAGPPDAALDDAAAVDGALDLRTPDARPRDAALSDSGLAPRQCRAQSDCTAGFECLAPGAPAPCGTCRPPDVPCSTDGACASFGANFICDTTPCICNGEKSCLAGCATDKDCATGMACGVDHRCALPTCANDVECGPNGACSSGRCVPRPCQSDADCADYCVEGACYDMPGTCTALPA